MLVDCRSTVNLGTAIQIYNGLCFELHRYPKRTCYEGTFIGEVFLSHRNMLSLQPLCKHKSRTTLSALINPQLWMKSFCFKCVLVFDLCLLGAAHQQHRGEYISIEIKVCRQELDKKGEKMATTP